ncbi:MAG: GntR family transcriptional regulator [Reyranellaceae bacterium]
MRKADADAEISDAAAPAADGRAPQLPRMQRQTLQEDVYDALRQALMNGQFVPGEPLILRDLARALGTSMMPVRDALVRLVAEGAVELLPNRTAVLPMMTRDRLRQLYRVRIALEAMLVEEAAGRVSADEMEVLAALIERMHLAYKAVDVTTFLRHNREFHFTIYRAAREDVLFRMMETLWLQVGPFIHFSLTPHGMKVGNDHHRDALAAMRTGDVKGACRAMERDIADAVATIMRNLPDPSRERPAEAGKAKAGAKAKSRGRHATGRTGAR